MKMNAIANGHKKLDESITDLGLAAKKKAEEIRKNVLNQYSDAKDAVGDFQKEVQRSPWKAIAKVAVISAAVGFCVGFLKRK